MTTSNIIASRYQEDDFYSFVEEIIKLGRLDGKELGIAKWAIDNGYENLSEKQKFIFETSFEPFILDSCSRCPEDIPWCEMVFAVDISDGQCTWCYQTNSHED